MNVVSDSDIAAAAALDGVARACAMVEKAAGIEEGSIVVARLFEVGIYWLGFMQPADREHHLRHWLEAERLFRALMNKEIPQVPG
jgi:hypothetical protein